MQCPYSELDLSQDFSEVEVFGHIETRRIFLIKTSIAKVIEGTPRNLFLSIEEC